jgi:small subunit ribosomal protein S6e
MGSLTMAELKLVIGNKDGKSYNKSIEDSSTLIGRKIGDTVSGDLVDLAGYELKITGGSNDSGFPMRPGLDHTGKKKIYASSGIGINTKFKGTYIRKTVAGNTVGQKTSQLNLMVTKIGSKALNDLLGKKEEAKEGKTSQEETKEQPKIEEKPKEKEAKPEPKKEEQKETKKNQGDKPESQD